MNYILLSAVFLLTTLFGNAQPKSSQGMKRYMDMISTEGLSSSLHFITSDHFEGRGAGTTGEKSAAQYLASCYQWMGIAAIKVGKEQQ